jgi:hypothetical protein
VPVCLAPDVPAAVERKRSEKLDATMACSQL